MDLTPGSTLTMNDGHAIPRLGFGVFRAAPGHETRASVRAALEAGYRHVDTARIYGNEADVGAAIRDSGLRREDVFVTTKLWNADQGYESALRAARGSLERLGVGHADLYLIHWPVPGQRLESWRALVQLRRDGWVRSIGVSNYLVRHLRELIDRAGEVPAVNQVELSPFLPQRELREFCRERGIVVEAYSPLTRGLRLGHPALARIAARHDVSPARVLIRWALQQDVVVLAKSSRPERIRENADVFGFALDDDDRRILDDLGENLHTGWDPTEVP
jgi:diketogulonate reductase-like aldo/keto reductase